MRCIGGAGSSSRHAPILSRGAGFENHEPLSQSPGFAAPRMVPAAVPGPPAGLQLDWVLEQLQHNRGASRLHAGRCCRGAGVLHPKPHRPVDPLPRGRVGGNCAARYQPTESGRNNRATHRRRLESQWPSVEPRRHRDLLHLESGRGLGPPRQLAGVGNLRRGGRLARDLPAHQP